MNGDRRRSRGRPILVTGLSMIALVMACVVAPSANADLSEFDFKEVSGALSTAQAAAHPDFTTTFALDGDPAELDGFGQPYPWGGLREADVELPPGFAGNQAAFPTCKTVDLLKFSFLDRSAPCPTDSQVGVVSPGLWSIVPIGAALEPLYIMSPPGGDVVARLGFIGVVYPVLIDVRIDPQRDNALTASVVNPPAIAGLTGTTTTLWGVPTDSSHDTQRFTPEEALFCGGPCGNSVPSGLSPTAFMTNPTSCGPAQVDFAAESYPGFLATPMTAVLPDIADCEQVPFDPAMSLQPTTRDAGSSSGMDVDLRIPQDGLIQPEGLGSAHLKKTVVTLPEGMSLNASAGDGLAGCSEAQIGLTSESPIRFDATDPRCPDGSKVGSATITTPVLSNPVEGVLYLADPADNPFHTLLSGYLVAHGQGVLLKVAGRFELDPGSGRITAVFDDNPQLPFDDLRLHFKGGGRGVLTMPSRCDTYASGYQLTPWSGKPPSIGNSSFAVGGNCDAGFNPGFQAGTEVPLAGSFSPFSLRVTREPGSPRLGGLEVSPPPGLLGKLAGVPYCPDSALASIPEALGSAAAQLANPSCPSASEIGTVAVGAGSGSPFYVRTGKAYLAGPYKGAPLSLAVVTPALAGPFDLGNVVVRTALRVDPETTRITAVSDPLPTVLHGIPLDLRDVRVEIDRPDFTLNPTDCDPMAVDGRVASTDGVVAPVSSRFQVGACRGLDFRPRLGFKLSGRTSRGGHPRLRAVVEMPKHGANIARARVALPHSEFLDQAHIKTICTRVQFATDSCPAGAVYGHARAFTPLLDKPLEGPVYLRSSSHELPDLVADLRGQIHVAVAGRIDSVNGGIRTTFARVPDAPVSKFVLTMKGGKKGLLVNSTNLCTRRNAATAQFVGQNGKRRNLKPVLRNDCP
ncbi:MAG TPA: hypothetical protein VF245_08915 [Solirubrobacterales bacterium]